MVAREFVWNPLGQMRASKPMEPAPTYPSATEWVDWLAEAERRSKDVYKRSPERLIAEYRREREITRGYHGREVLELLQNAADAARALGVSGKVRIVVTPSGLLMGNTGQPFDTGGVQSLQTANLSPKRQRESVVIGDKGLGFRSILNWTHSPLISSGELGLAFMPSYARGVVDGLAAESQDLAQCVADEQEIAGDLIVPRLAFPQWIANWEGHAWPDDEGLRSIAHACSAIRREGFDTVVGMPFSTPQAYQEAVRQVDELEREFLLLVDSIGRLEIQIDDRENRTWSCDRSDGRCILRDGGQDVSIWMVDAFESEIPGELLDHGEHNRNRFQVTIAVPNEGQAGPGCLFCYFPTEVQIPLPLLAHATVELDETRKHMNDTRANRHILKVMTERIAELAEQQIVRQGADDWAGCRMVTPVGAWGRELEHFGIPATLKEAARQKKLVPVLGGGHRSAMEANLAPGDVAKWWAARLFPEMAAAESEEENKFAEHLDVEPLPTDQLLQRLLAAKDLTLNERAHAIAGLLQIRHLPVNDNLAILLCDETETPLPAGASAILQPTGELPPLPSWATIRFLHSELRQKLGVLLETKDSRELQQKLRSFGVVEYSLSALIRPVMAEANRQVRDHAHDEPLIRGEVLQFLLRIHQAVGGDTAFPADTTVKLLNQAGNWVEPKLLYLGEGYGLEGSVTQDLYGGWAWDKLVVDPAQLGLEAADSGDITSFLGWLGVARWPRETEVDNENVDSGYLDTVKARLSYPVDFGECRFDSPRKLLGVLVLGAKTLDGISEFLTKAPSEAILAWLVFDPRSTSWMRPSSDHGRLAVCPPYKQHYRFYSGAILSYIHWKVSTIPWLPATDGTQKAPQRCLIGDRQWDRLFPSPSPPDPTLLERYGISSRLNDAFRHAGVMPGLAQLGRDDLYRLLLEVPELSPDGKAGRALCRWFVTNESYVFGSAGPYQKRFMREGKIWGTKQGVSGYYPLAELRHIDQEGLPPALISKLPVADLPKRIGTQKVKDVLGIKPLERLEIRQELVSHRKSPGQEDWAAWFDAAKPFIKRLRQTQTKQTQTVMEFDRLELVVCDELRVQMQYEEAVYNHTAQEGEWFVFSDRLYVQVDLDGSLDLLADTVGVAVASVFDMAGGDNFAKILRCEPRQRRKLLKRMCGDDFHEEIEAAIAKPRPTYTGSIHPPIESKPNQADGNLEEQQPEKSDKSEHGSPNQEAKSPGVIPVPHEPQPPPVHRNLVVRNVQRTTSAHNGNRKLVDGERCEIMAALFEEQCSPKRYALGVGHITGLDAPGCDLVSFDSESDREEFRNSEERDLSRVRRFIEVKGRSSSTAKIELKGNELKAAREYGDRYYLYRFYEVVDNQFCVSILQNPMAAEEAKSTIIEINLDRAHETNRYDFVVEIQADIPSNEESNRLNTES